MDKRKKRLYCRILSVFQFHKIYIRFTTNSYKQLKNYKAKLGRIREQILHIKRNKLHHSHIVGESTV